MLLLIAWVVASLLKFLIARALTASKFDERLGSEAGVDEDRRIPLTKSISETAYWLIFLLFLPAVLGALQIEGLLHLCCYGGASCRLVYGADPSENRNKSAGCLRRL